jgi:hypothetical protein
MLMIFTDLLKLISCWDRRKRLAVLPILPLEGQATEFLWPNQSSPMVKSSGCP